MLYGCFIIINIIIIVVFFCVWFRHPFRRSLKSMADPEILKRGRWTADNVPARCHLTHNELQYTFKSRLIENMLSQ